MLDMSEKYECMDGGREVESNKNVDGSKRIIEMNGSILF